MEVTSGRFAALIAPLSVDTFFAEHWEAKPLHLRRDVNVYAALPTPLEIDEIIASGVLRYPSIQLARGGGFLPPESFTRTVRQGDALFTGLPDVAQIETEYRNGATISLPGFHRVSPAVGALAAALADELDHAIHANVYLTPGNAAGFTPHYDTHETFILQLGGAKHWRVYAPPLTLPHQSQPFSPEGYKLPAAPLFELDLEAGDLLYLPRGFVHSTTTAESYSAHITIGVTVYTWIELAAELLQAAKEKPEFRRALPPGFANRRDVQAGIKPELRRLFAALAAGAEGTELIERLSRKAQAIRFDAGGSFRSDISLVGPQTRLRRTAGDWRIGERERSLILACADSSWTLPPQTRPAVEAIAGGRVVQANDLPGLSPESGLTLLRFLHGKGLVTEA